MISESFNDFAEAFRQPWKPISTQAFIGWAVFYAASLLYAFANRGEYLFIDNVNLVIHEGGHPLFSYFGHTLMIWGGTLLELFVPFALALYFATMRQLTGAAFCAFFFFENFLYISVYMADARAMALPLVTAGDSDFVEHDWNFIFSQLGVLQYDRRIAAVVQALGWLGMLTTVGWLGWRWRQDSRAIPKSRKAAGSS